MIPLSIRHAVQKDITDIVHLADEGFGAGYLIHEDLVQSQSSDDALLMVALARGDIIGFGTARIVDESDLLDIVRIPRELKFSPPSVKVGILESVAVSSEYRKSGVSVALITACIDAIFARGISSFYSAAWKRGESIPIENVLRGLGWHDVGEVPGYWSGKDTERDYVCPECFSQPCKCTAVIFTTAKSV